MKNIAYFDIETEAIPSTGSKDIRIIHAIGVRLNDGPVMKYTRYYIGGSDGSLREAVRILNEADLIVSFNGIAFDVPVIEKVLNCKLTAPHLDLILVAKLMFTKDELLAIDPKLIEDKGLWGKFSLKAFGIRMGGKNVKLEYEDWSRLTAEMLTYMEADVDVTADIYHHLVVLPTFPLANVLETEHAIARIIQKQMDSGFHFDLEKARVFNMEMLREKFTIERRIQKIFRPRFLKDGPERVPAKPRKNKNYLPYPTFKLSNVLKFKRPWYTQKNGKYKFPAKSKMKWFDTPMRLSYIYTDGAHQPIALMKFEATDNQIKIWLKALYDFEFFTYTAKGNVKVDRQELSGLGDYGKDLKRLMKLKKDLSQLSGTEKSLIARCDPITNSIHGRVDTIGAATHRCTHSGPNLAQIPAGADFRGLFNVPEGMVLVGADLANIEIRVLAHYLFPYDGGKYAEAVLSKDMHWLTQQIAA